MAILITLVDQSQAPHDILRYILWGNKGLGGTEERIMMAGGVVPMFNTMLVIYISFALAGLVEGIHALDRMRAKIENIPLNRYHRFGVTSAVSAVTAACGFTQSVATVMTCDIVKTSYDDTDRSQLALDLENSGIVLAALIPWNIAALAPTTTMNVSAAGFIPYAFYLYILPITYFIYLRYKSKVNKTHHLTQQVSALLPLGSHNY